MHLSSASHKATRILNHLRRSMYRCRRSANKRAFTALVRPLLEYAATDMESPCMRTATGKAALEKVQRRAAHWICSKWDKHIVTAGQNRTTKPELNSNG